MRLFNYSSPALALFGFLALAPTLFADFVEPVPLILPPNSTFSLPGLCIMLVCLEDVTISHFNITNNALTGGNEVVSADVTMTAGAYRNVSGMPGAFISPVTASGDIDITYFDKDTYSQLGSFNAQITGLDVMGSFNGHTIDATIESSTPGDGQATIEQISSNPLEYRVQSFFDIFTELSIDGGALNPGPERVAELSQTPEPSYYAAVGALLFVLAALRFGLRRGGRVTLPS